MEKITLKIEGMMCKHCAAHVEEALNAVEGVKKAKVSLKDNEATIKAENVSTDALIKAVEDAGYKASI